MKENSGGVSNALLYCNHFLHLELTMADKKAAAEAGKKQAINLEASMQALETLVLKMESGELTLEASLAAFEEGIRLSQECQQALENAEQKVRVLMEKSTSAPLLDFQEAKTSPPSKLAQQDNSFDDDIPF